MADEDGKRSKGSSFLKKSKWGKILKEKEPSDPGTAPAGRQGTFKLNEDVVDFLKPSTEKHVPKIDIAIAKRWPDAHDVRRAGEASPLPFGQQQQQQGGGHAKPKRRKGLTVSFVKTVPEIMGEGGDEASDPPREISRMKAMVSRSVSDRRPGTMDHGAHMPRSPPLPQARGAPPPQQVREEVEEDFRPVPMRRVQTHNEFSPPLQRKVASPPIEEVEPHRPSVGRTPTGFRNHDIEHTTPLDTPVDKLGSAMGGSQQEPSRPYSRDRPTITTQFDFEKTEEPKPAVSYSHTLADGLGPRKGYGGLSPHDAASPVAQKRREMSTSEGMMFRRASMLIQKEEDDDKDEDARIEELRQASLSAQNSALSSVGTSQPEVFSPSNTTLTPETAITPDAPNPFADPKYIKRHSREVAPDPSQRTEAPAVQSLRQQHHNPQAYSRAQQSSGPYQSRLDPYQSRSRETSEPREQPPRSVPAPKSAAERVVPHISPPQPHGHQRVSSGDENYMRAIQPPEGDMVPLRQAPVPQKMGVPSYPARERSKSPALRDRIFDSSAGAAPEKPPTLFTRPNGSTASVNHFSPSPSHSRSGSRDGNHSPQLLQPAGHGLQQQQAPPSPRFQSQQYSQSPQSNSPRSSLLGPSRTGPALWPRGSPEDYFAAPTSPQPQPAKSPAAHLRQEESQRPGSASSNLSASRPSVSPQPPAEGNPAADMAFSDFAGRVAHMKGVFRLTAEKELPHEICTPSMWLRAGLWWYLNGKAGLEVLLNQRNPGDRREFLTQAHVDLAKAWWILTDSLEPYDSLDQGSPGNGRSGSADSPDIAALRPAVASLRSHLRTLSLSMGKNHIFPPTQSLIQGQDTRIWLDYPRFTSGAAAVLGGNANNSFIIDDSKQLVDPYDLLPLGDTRDAFCYGRFPVEVFINTEEADTDRVVLPCMLTVLRGRRDYQTSLAIASQNELVNIKIAPRQNDRKTHGWSDVSWKASSLGMTIRLPRGFDLSVRMQERDFRAVWNLSEYARKVEKSLRAEQDEKLVHEKRLAELQYADSSNLSSFPADKIRGCIAHIYERTVTYTDGNGMRKLHRGYRMLLITDSGHKMLSSVSHDICRGSPLYFEYLTDSAANGTTAMVIRIREERRQCRILLVFPDMQSRQELYNVLNGLTVSPDETIVSKMSLNKLNIEPAIQSAGFAGSANPALQGLQWQKLGVTNGQPDDPNSRIPSTVQSDHLRIVARHSTGCITDRLNLAKGELRLRLPITDTPTIEILRDPQEDLTMSIDTRHSPQQVSDGIGQLLQTVLSQPTIRTFTFASQADLHAFQTAITGFTVRYDGLASTFGISRRRMVVPIYKKWEASNVRLQIVSKDSVFQLMSFMEDFSHAESLCFQIKSTDTFENVKGDNKNKKWAVKMVDAKFSLPDGKGRGGEKGEGVGEEERAGIRGRRRFVNLEGLEYAEEHDDITVGFESESDRDRFAQALPAATSVSRGITLKRRI